MRSRRPVGPGYSPVVPDTRQIRESYLPDELRVLFIGESPPESGKFFYCANTLLHDATREAFAAGSRAFRGDAEFPRAFERAGCYLEDLADEPVNGLKGAKRRQACKAGIEPLAERIKGFTPRVVVTVGYGVSDYIGRSLELAGLAETEREKLPFPTSYRRAVDNVPYRQVYSDELAALVARWRKHRVLLT